MPPEGGRAGLGGVGHVSGRVRVCVSRGSVATEAHLRWGVGVACMGA